MRASRLTMQRARALAVRACATVATFATLATCAAGARAQTPAPPPASASAMATTPAGARIALASFFNNPVFTGAQLSPDARALALRFGGANGMRERLGVLDLASNTIKIVAQFGDSDVGDFQWVNNDRLVFNARDKQIADADVRFGPGLYAVNRDATGLRQLVDQRVIARQERAGTAPLLPASTFLLPQLGRQDSDSVYVTAPKRATDGDIDYVNLLRLNTVTGRAVTIERPAHTRSWLLDEQGEPRVVTAIDKGIESVWYRAPADGAWRKLAEFNAYTGGKNAFTPVAFAPDGTLYVDADLGSDKHALHAYDLAANAIVPDALVTLKDYDFRGALVVDSSKLLGVRFLSDANGTVWFDARMKAVQADIDAQLPGLINIVAVAKRAATPWVTLLSYSDRQPPIYSLYNTQTKAFNKVGDSYPAIDATRMATKELVHYAARDGLSIPAWLTRPPDSAGKRLPMVVLVHGGPYVRGGQWNWEPSAQFLASRGYAVLEPEYRGSTGFGRRHFEAGWKQWGLAMQNDIADGTRWAIGQGIAAADRVCIAGASYGGYATLMGLLNDPALYKCGIDWVGVTDIALLFTGNWRARDDLSAMYREYGMPVLVGDPVKDAAQFTATSPLAQAARITQPLLLAYGGADLRVPAYHGKKFYDAVKPTNPDVEWIVYDDEGHGWRLPQNRIDFWGRVEKFLDRNIGH